MKEQSGMLHEVVGELKSFKREMEAMRTDVDATKKDVAEHRDALPARAGSARPRQDVVGRSARGRGFNQRRCHDLGAFDWAQAAALRRVSRER